MTNAVAVLSFAAFLLIGSAAFGASCDSAGRCQIMDLKGATFGEYWIYRPKAVSAVKPAGAIFFLHGWKAKAAVMVKNKSLRALADRLGAVLILPQSDGDAWSYAGSPYQQRDEFAFFEALRRQAVQRHKLDEKRLLMSGFSMGASMVWNLACHAPRSYAAFAPMAGAFWEPLPETCSAGARTLWHLHGLNDDVVPISGRQIGALWRQGDVWRSLDVIMADDRAWSRTDGLDEKRRDCSSWKSKGVESASYRFCRHKGGHIWRAAWIEKVWRALSQGR